MTEGQVGMLIFITITLISSIIWHLYNLSFDKAVVGATVTSVVIFQVIAYLQSDCVDPFFWIAVAMSALYSCVIAIGVGVVFGLFRKKTRE